MLELLDKWLYTQLFLLHISCEAISQKGAIFFWWFSPRICEYSRVKKIEEQQKTDPDMDLKVNEFACRVPLPVKL